MFIIELFIFAYLAFYVIYTFVLSLSAKLSKTRRYPLTGKNNKICVFIPAYKEDEVIYSVAEDAIHNNYPKADFDVFVIADTLQKSTINKLSQLPIKIVEVSFEISTKTKALNVAFDTIKDSYDIAVILDADNIMERDFLLKINSAYNAGHFAVQTRRTAKNDNNSLAVLDGISEAINNHIFRKGFNAIGISSTLIGSGMAFDYKLLKESLSQIKAIGGFDRELQIKINEQGHKILYLEDAIVYDEKVEHPEVFQNQRKRWMSSQFVYLKKYFVVGIKSLFRLDFNSFNMTIISNIFLPRVLMLLIIPLLTIIYIIWNSYLFLNPSYYFVILVLFIVSLFIAIPGSFFNRKLLRALFRLPHAMLIMVKSILNLKGANKRFLHTPHKAVNMVKDKGK